jgi:hypothetical protein
VTHQVNNKRGYANHKRPTHCPQGHPYAGENLYLHPTGNLVCRLCSREANRRYQKRKKLLRGR